MLKKIGYFILGIVAITVIYQIYHVNFNYRITEITKDKVYSSGVIPPEKIENKLKKLGVKTVIDLRIDSNYDPLNPSSESAIALEKKAIEKIDGVNHINIPSKQIPSPETLDKFLSVMDNEDIYPVLIHCHHGIGRAKLYSALYRIEYEDYENEEARQKTRFPLIFSNFSKNSKKGKFLINYEKRK